MGAGLPQIAELAGEAKSYAERLFKFPKIGVLEPRDAFAVLREPAVQEGATFDQDALDLACEVTGRYPYFIQELGYAVWPLATGQHITRGDVDAAQRVYEEKLDSSFFRVRLDRTTELERAYLRAMAELGSDPQLAGEVAKLLTRTSEQCGPTRSTLIEKGLPVGHLGWRPDCGIVRCWTNWHVHRPPFRAVRYAASASPRGYALHRDMPG